VRAIRRYKKIHNRDIMNAGLDEKAKTRKKIDLIKSLVALLFDVQFGKSPPGTIRPIQQIERQIELITKLNKIPLFIEKEGIISNTYKLIVEIETREYVEEFSFKKYLVGVGRSTLMKMDFKDAGYNSFTIKEAEKLYTIALKIIHIHKELDRRNYQGIKAPSKGAIDNIQKLINILIVNDK
jgi:hypothetical protein